MTVTLYNANDEPIKNAAFTFTISLVSQADTDIFKTTPTLAAGDVQISKDGGNFANIGTLPTEVQSSGVLAVALTAAEMNADRVDVLFRDATGAEWQDAQVTIFTKVAVTLPEAADVWLAGTRTLTQSAAQVAATLAGSTITLKRGDTLSVALTGLGSLANRSKLYFAVKLTKDLADTASLIYVEETAGLVYSNGAAATSGNGSLVVDVEGDGDITVTVNAGETANFTPQDYSYEVQIVRSSGTPVSTLTAGTFKVEADVVKATT